MPCICEFDGIRIYMYDNEHRPPHFHVFVRGEAAVVDLNTLDVSAGRLPRADRRKVVDWAKRHKAELERNWARIERKEILERIEP